MQVEKLLIRSIEFDNQIAQLNHYILAGDAGFNPRLRLRRPEGYPDYPNRP